jgi:hypothetical protein
MCLMGHLRGCRDPVLKLVDENPCVFGVVDRYGHHVHPAALERRLQDGNEVLTGLHARSPSTANVFKRMSKSYPVE